MQKNIFIYESSITNGKVVGFKERLSLPRKLSNNSNDRIVYYPIVEYTTNNGTTQRITSKEGNKPPIYKLGDTLEVRYKNNNPAIAHINSTHEIWGISIFTCGLGIILIIFSILPIKKHNK